MNGIPLALSEQQVSPGVLGFCVVALLGLALFFLIRSMNKQMRKINFDDGSDPAVEPEPQAEAKTEARTEVTAKPTDDGEN